MEYYECNLDSDTNVSLQLYLYKNVQNIEKIRSNIVKGNWSCAVIKPTLILDPFQVAVAANRAVISEKSNALVTKTVYAEILYNLSITKNISQSLSKFGIEKDNTILLCFLNAGNNTNKEDILKQIEGEQCAISDLHQLTNIKDLKTTYKLNNIKGDYNLLDVIVSRMNTKSFVSF